MGLFKKIKEENARKNIERQKEQEMYSAIWEFLSPGSPYKMSNSYIKQEAEKRAMRALQIVDDCRRILSETTDADVFFGRLDLFSDELNTLCVLEPILKFQDSKPSDIKNALEKEQDDIILAFIDRCYDKSKEKAEKLKTPRGKKNQFIKMFEKLSPYVDRFSDRHKARFEEIKKAEELGDGLIG